MILHGLFGSSRNWKTIASSLSQRLRQKVICIDLPNHGKSVQFDARGKPLGCLMTWDALTDRLEDLVCEYQANILLGHSLGGQAVMQSLFHRPALQRKTQKSIIVDIAPSPLKFANTKLDVYLQTMQKIERDFSDRKTALEEFRKIESDEMIVQFLFTNYGEGRFLLPLADLRNSMLGLAATYTYPNEPITTPTLFIKGQRSNYIDSHSEELMRKYFKDYTISEIPDAGHWPHFENSNVFLERVCSFICIVCKNKHE